MILTWIDWINGWFIFLQFSTIFSQVNCISGVIARLKASNYLRYPFNTVLRQLIAWESCPSLNWQDTYACSIPNKGLHSIYVFYSYSLVENLTLREVIPKRILTICFLLHLQAEWYSEDSIHWMP